MLISIFIIALGVPIYSYFIYPAVVMLWGFLAPRSIRKDDQFSPSVTLIISAYNEERVIRKKLENSLTLDYPKDRLEIVVASESTDRTDEIVREFLTRGIQLMNFKNRRGKVATLYRVVPQVRGEILVFSDANSFYRPDAIRKLVRNFVDPTVGCAVGQLQYGGNTRSVGATGEKLYWAYDLLFRKFANRGRGLVPGINGGIFGIRKDLYLPFSEERGDDFELCTRIAIRGHQVVSESEAFAEEEASETTPQQFRRKIRLVRWNIVSTLLLLREAIHFRCGPVTFQMISHRLLRYTVPFWLLLALASSFGLSRSSDLFLGLFALQVLFYAVALFSLAADLRGIRLPHLCLIPSYFLMVNSAAAFALLGGLGRKQSAIWNKER